jgi:hypothetical protein
MAVVRPDATETPPERERAGSITAIAARNMDANIPNRALAQSSASLHDATDAAAAGTMHLIRFKFVSSFPSLFAFAALEVDLLISLVFLRICLSTVNRLLTPLQFRLAANLSATVFASARSSARGAT